MTLAAPKSLIALSAVALAIGTLPAASQSAMTPAQCETMLMVGAQNYAASAVAGCSAYFQSLAQNAAAPGAFSASTSGGVIVTVATSGSGG
ncbi:hypothetical protein [Gymnodinialimonas sp.]